MADLDPQQAEALERALVGENLFVTGPGGTGKTHLIRALVAACAAAEPAIQVAVTATTGAAAVLLGGTTLHKFLGMGLCDGSLEVLRAAAARRARGPAGAAMRRVRLLIVDEVSMLPRNFLDRVDLILRVLRREDRFFGGLQVVFFGDFYQLPPVDTRAGFAFESAAWAALIDDANVIQLRTPHRQADPAFFALLQRARAGALTDADRAALDARVGAPLAPALEAAGVRPTRVVPHRAVAERLNMRELAKLPDAGQVVLSAATVARGVAAGQRKAVAAQLERLVRDVPVPSRLPLRVGAQVTLTWNLDVSRGLVNGARGLLVGIEGSCEADALQRWLDDAGPPLSAFPREVPAGLPSLVVRFKDATVPMPLVAWTRRADGLEPPPTLAVVGVPLRLGWADTVHAMQGATLDAAHVDLGVWEAGQAYVAVSRVRTLEGLVLDAPLGPRVFFASPKVQRYYARLARREAGPAPAPAPAPAALAALRRVVRARPAP